MLVSRFFISTLKEAPAEAELPSHQFMLRAGLIKRLGSGLYTWMPLGLRVYTKVESIVREEMNRAGAIELRMPVINPAELWQETGRWDKFGAQLLKIKDRADRDFLFAPTHEEVITDIVRKEVKSYKQLPLNFYHITQKFRDEIRPRFGVMRAREFVMKDAYSFDVDKAGMLNSYQKMYDAYTAIFTRLGLKFRAVAADNGSIGGSASHEFQVLADSGEDVIAYCDGAGSSYAANLEKAEAAAPSPRPAPSQAMAMVATPTQKTCEAVAALLQLPLTQHVKAVMFMAGKEQSEFLLCLVRADHSVNEVKLSHVAGVGDCRAATAEEIMRHLGVEPGFCGPVPAADAHPGKVRVVADRDVAVMADFVCGANQTGQHLVGVNWGRDLPEPDAVVDLRNVVEGDRSPDGLGTLKLCRGIEVGHVFALGNVYSKAMNASFLDANGKSQIMEMGCYGIGVTRVVAAAIEQNFDAKGIVWPAPMAPFSVSLIPVNYNRSETVKAAADQLYAALIAAGVDVLMDDRGERPGIMFADQELIGIPHRVVLGDRGLANGEVEYQGRQEAAATLVKLSDITALLTAKLQA